MDIQIKYDYTHGDYRMLLCYQDIWTIFLNQMKFNIWLLDLMDIQITFD